MQEKEKKEEKKEYENDKHVENADNTKIIEEIQIEELAVDGICGVY